MYDIFETVDAGDFALTTLVGSPNNGYLVVFADWYRANLIETEPGQKNMANLPIVYADFKNIEVLCGKGRAVPGDNGAPTLCFSRSSLLKGALMITRRLPEGALKCALRDFRREEEIPIG
jgi:hypothetical protein